MEDLVASASIALIASTPILTIADGVQFYSSWHGRMKEVAH